MLHQGNTSFDFDQDSLDHNQDSDVQLQINNPPSAFPPAYKESKSNHQQNTLKVNQQKGIKDKKSTSEHLSYDLTFKKDNTSMFTFNLQKAEGARQNLFHSPVQNPQNNTKMRSPYSINDEQTANKFQVSHLYEILNKQTSIKAINSRLLELSIDFQQGLGQVESLVHINRDGQCLAIIQNLQSFTKIKNLRKKRNSAKINLSIMKSATSQLGKQLSEGEKKRQQILELLRVQLEKKLFIECFKMGRINRICKQIFRKRVEEKNQIDIQYEANQNNRSEFSDNQFLNQQLFGLEEDGKDNPMQTSHKNDPPFSMNPYQQKSRIAVFCQILTSLLKKQTYSCFKDISGFQIDYNIEQESGKGEKQLQSERQQAEREQGQEFFFGGNTSGQEREQNKEDPIVQINLYIEQLKSELIRIPKMPSQLMRNYFLKWKIYFLQRILSKISNQDTSFDQRGQFDQKQEKKGKRKALPTEQIEEKYSSLKSIENDLKEEKKNLKVYLAIQRSKQFFNILKERLAQKRIYEVTEAYHHKNLIQKYFDILYYMKQETKLSYYAEQMADLQDESHFTTAVIFSKTNLITKAYFGLKRWVQTKKWVKTVQKSIIAYNFRSIRFLLCQDEVNETKLEKYLQRKKRKLIFKCFCGIKSISSLSQKKYQLERFKDKKDMQLIQLCFSALSLEYKKRLNLIKKVRQQICTNKVLYFLSSLKSNLEERYYAQNKMIERAFMSEKKSKKIFFNRLRFSYTQSLKRKRISIKQVKLEVVLGKRQTLQFLNRWRKLTICNYNYRLIELKLRKLKELEIKQSLFHTWMNRLAEKRRQKKNDRHTTNHKIWLSKYYQKLCALQNSEIS